MAFNLQISHLLRVAIDKVKCFLTKKKEFFLRIHIRKSFSASNLLKELNIVNIWFHNKTLSQSFSIMILVTISILFVENNTINTLLRICHKLEPNVCYILRVTKSAFKLEQVPHFHPISFIFSNHAIQ